MKLRETRDAYEALSAKASEIVRQLSLAGVALIWVFKPQGVSANFPQQLVRAALFFFLALVLDFLQYLSGTAIWHIYFRKEEKKGLSLDDEVSAPAQLNWPAWILFYLKSITVFFAYARYVIPYLICQYA